MIHEFFQECDLDYECKSISHPKESIEFIAEKFYEKHNKKIKRDYYAVHFIDSISLPVSETTNSSMISSTPPPSLYKNNEIHSNILINSIPDPINLQIPLQYCEPNELLDEFNPRRRINQEILFPILQSLEIDQYLEKDFFFYDTPSGLFKINLRDGNVYFNPNICRKCYRSCKKKDQYICIVAICRGYSNQPDIRQDELVVLSKILAIVDHQLPIEVQQQIFRLNSCDN
jgi:hypothetical protein